MASQEAVHSNHISLELLWSISRRESELSDKQRMHVIDCEECISTLGLCCVYGTLQKVEEKLKESSRK